MPENPLCVYCGQAVDIVGGTEEYVIPNKEQAVSKERWEYAPLEQARGVTHGVTRMGSGLAITQ
ncbi:hypothetical protein MYX04_10070 [Nitrospiraceae bacterium AH_259_D15_M11_P09]|nr:hypothetical protein [Nitrospiraceae bacterium AH_259_D15_M11_P09]